MSRAVMSSIAIAAALLAVTLIIGRNSGGSLPECEWCGATEAPDELEAEAVLAGPDERGDPLVVTGVVYLHDGETPAADVVVYAYHTDSTGRYARPASQRGNALRHGRLRGWVRTGEDGRYRFRTILPAPYPDGEEPAHVHLSVLPPGGREVWVDSVEFEGDPRLTDEQRASRTGRGGSGIVALEYEDDLAIARRDIVLPEEALEPAASR